MGDLDGGCRCRWHLTVLNVVVCDAELPQSIVNNATHVLLHLALHTTCFSVSNFQAEKVYLQSENRSFETPEQKCIALKVDAAAMP